MRISRWFGPGILAAVLFLAVYLFIDLISVRGDRLYDFFNERSFLQPVTVYVSGLVAALLLARLLGHRRRRTQLDRAMLDPNNLPEAIARRLDAVRSTRDEHGEGAAAACAERDAEDERGAQGKAYETIGYVTGLIPALGLFGTMLGVSNALFTAFSGGSLGPEAVERFVGGLATAMDTTLLAMACSMPLFGFAWLLERVEHGLADDYERYVRQQCSVPDIAQKTDSTAALQAELRGLTRRIAAEAKATFAQFLGSAAEDYRQSIERAVQDVFETQRAHDQSMVQQVALEVATALRESVETMGEVIREHNQHVATEMTDHVGRLEQALHNRTPEEVVVRYRHNGRLHRQTRINHKEVANVAN